jgi:hypothetical protein
MEVLEGFCKELVKLAGPVQLYIAPEELLLAVKFKVLPLHKGLLLEAVGVAGAEGLTKVKGPAALEEQPLSVAVMFEYVPAERLGIVKTPFVFAINVIVVGVPLFFV